MQARIASYGVSALKQPFCARSHRRWHFFCFKRQRLCKHKMALTRFACFRRQALSERSCRNHLRVNTWRHLAWIFTTEPVKRHSRSAAWWLSAAIKAWQRSTSAARRCASASDSPLHDFSVSSSTARRCASASDSPLHDFSVSSSTARRVAFASDSCLDDFSVSSSTARRVAFAPDSCLDDFSVSSSTARRVAFASDSCLDVFSVSSSTARRVAFASDSCRQPFCWASSATRPFASAFAFCNSPSRRFASPSAALKAFVFCRWDFNSSSGNADASFRLIGASLTKWMTISTSSPSGTPLGVTALFFRVKVNSSPLITAWTSNSPAKSNVTSALPGECMGLNSKMHSKP